MKRTTVLLITLVCLSLQVTFGQQKEYKSIRNFSNDTAKYLKYNFRERGKDLYKGITFDELISSLEIQPLGAYPTWRTNYQTGITDLVALDLFFTCYNGKGFSPREDESIHVVFETRIITTIDETRRKRNQPAVKGLAKYDSAFELFKAYPYNKWVPQHYEFFKNCKIKRVENSYWH